MIAKVYIAGPYSKGDVAVNVKNAFVAANQLADLGFAPFVPHATHFWHMFFPRPYEFWLQLDNQFLPCCNAVLRIPGESGGADKEVLLAESLEIPVFFNISDLTAHFGSQIGNAGEKLMNYDVKRSTERSVDSLQKIYAVIIGFGISQSLLTLLRDDKSALILDPHLLIRGWSQIIALFVTLVPFWHGMNRHLDRCYLEKTDKVVRGALLFDFVIFFVEAGLLFAAGLYIKTGITTYYCLGTVLVMDVLWAFISHQIHFPNEKSHSIKWSAINLIAIAISLGVIAYPFEMKPTLLMSIAIVRTIVDYYFCWKFYYPPPLSTK